ncbi:hypothetical protein EDB87DRAFT_1279241 [Lactarius vividus]|nr:hypothetical protein EDB87DRAFT_1279241 [Lactarius vividus]
MTYAQTAIEVSLVLLYLPIVPALVSLVCAGGGASTHYHLDAFGGSKGGQDGSCLPRDTDPGHTDSVIRGVLQSADATECSHYFLALYGTTSKQ